MLRVSRSNTCILVGLLLVTGDDTCGLKILRGRGGEDEGGMCEGKGSEWKAYMYSAKTSYFHIRLVRCPLFPSATPFDMLIK